MIKKYLIGNADAHAKNISLLLPEEGSRLAPFYGLMCTAVYPELTDRIDAVAQELKDEFVKRYGTFKVLQQICDVIGDRVGCAVAD